MSQNYDLDAATDTYAIYQLKDDESTRDRRFEPMSYLKKQGITIQRNKYSLVYSGELKADTTIADIFVDFNIDIPADFKGHSMSVSDIVVIRREGKETAYFVDGSDSEDKSGFVSVPEFLMDSRKKPPKSKNRDGR